MSRADNLTILRSKGTPLCKRWTADGERPEPLRIPWQFTSHEVEAKNLQSLAALLKGMEAAKDCALIRGAYVGEEAAAALLPELVADRVARWERAGHHGPKPVLAPEHVPRVGKLFVDQRLHLVMIDIDDFRPLDVDPVLDPAAACLQYIEAVLPACFKGCAFCWQLSGSAGHSSCAGKLKAHIWFWLDTPYTSAELLAWATTIPPVPDAGLDTSVFSPVQLLFTAAPIFDPGVVDPVPAGGRSGLWAGERETVPLVLSPQVLADALAGQQRRAGPVGPRC